MVAADSGRSDVLCGIAEGVVASGFARDRPGANAV